MDASPQKTSSTGKNPAIYLLHLVVQGAMLCIVGFSIGFAIPEIIPSRDPLAFIKILAFYLPIYFLCIAAHEGGHLLAQKLIGHEFLMANIGPLLITNTGKRLHIHYRPLPGISGLSMGLPADAEERRGRQFFYVLGGPLGSLVLGILTLTAYFALPQASRVWQTVFLVIAVLSLSLAILNLVPFQTPNFPSDGAYLWKLLFNRSHNKEKEKQIKQAHLALITAARSGSRPRQWDSELIQVLLHEDNEPATVAYGCNIGLYTGLDRGDFEYAGKLLEKALSLHADISPLLKGHLFIEAAYLEARYGKGAQPAYHWLSEGKKLASVEPHTVLRATAAAQLAEGDHKLAIETIHKGIQAAQTSIEPGTAAAEVEWMKEIEVEALAMLAEPGGPKLVPPKNLLNITFPTKQKLTSAQRLFEWGQFLLKVVLYGLMLITMFYMINLNPPPPCRPRVLDNLICKFQARQELSTGIKAYKTGEYLQAQKHFTTALQHNPYETTAHQYRARIAILNGDFRLATEDVVAAMNRPNHLTLDEEESMLIYEAFQIVPDRSLLIQEFQQAIEQQPDNPLNYCKMGLAYLAWGDIDLAYQAFAQGGFLDESGLYYWCWYPNW